MSAKKAAKVQQSESFQALRIGTRVRCTDDGALGKIVWANAASVKIKWDDGEQVTWKRDSLASKPLEMFDPAEDGDPATPPEVPAVEERQHQIGTEVAPASSEATPSEEPPQPQVPVPQSDDAPAPPADHQPEDEPALPAAAEVQASAPAKPKSAATAKKLSALDAAAKVLAEVGQPMSCQEMIAAMAEKGYWTSPGGKTPAATLYSAILRELQAKGDQARFQKIQRGKFARNGVA